MSRLSNTQIYLQQTYAERTSNQGHFFDESTMKFFGSKIYTEAFIDSDDNIYFLESSQPPHGSRRYTVRKMTDDGDISTVATETELRYARRELKRIEDESISSDLLDSGILRDPGGV